MPSHAHLHWSLARQNCSLEDRRSTNVVDDWTGSGPRGDDGGSGALAAACADAEEGIVSPEAAPPETAPVEAVAAAAAYTPIVGDDWKSYANKAALKAADQFWWFRSGDVWNEVDLAQDPTFGQVARIRFLQSTEADWAPKLSASFSPRDKIWYRWRMKYSPGWTTVGTMPAGYNNAYKVAFWLWDGYEGRGQVEVANTSEYVLGWRVSQSGGGAAMQYTQRELPGSQSWGHVSTEFTDNQWWEYVIYYEKTGPTSARNHWWKRRLTNNGAVANNPWTYIGIEVTGATTPRANGIMLGANKNRNNTSTAYIYWGPWEVVDGSQYANPFGMPNVAGGGSSPTLTGVTLAPDSASLAPGGKQQFSANGRYSDGSIGAVSVTYSATGGTITSAGAYTAPASAGTYQVIAREASGKADTARVRVSSAPSATLQQVIVTPPTASAQAGKTVQFSAQGRYSDGSTKAVPVTWSATGGTISTAGLYTAGQTAGTYRVIGVAQGSTRADTSAVTVTAGTTTPPGDSFQRMLGDDWRAYTNTSQLSKYYSASDLRNVSLVTDKNFGRVLRLTQRAGSTTSPRLIQSLPTRSNRVWYRWRARYSTRWTTSDGGWTMAQLGWTGYTGAAGVGFSGSKHALSLSVRNTSGTYQRYTESQLSGSRTWGRVETDGQWFEYVMLWEKTGASTGRAHWWMRRLTSGGAIVNNSWTYYGVSLSGAATPDVGVVRLGAGNLTRAPSATQYVDLGPWDVVDGTRFANPFGMPGF